MRRSRIAQPMLLGSGIFVVALSAGGLWAGDEPRPLPPLSTGTPPLAIAPELAAVPIERVNTMGIPPDDPYASQGDPAVWVEYRRVIAQANLTLTLEPILKWDFYRRVEGPDHVLTVQTADQALWANVLLTVGCRTD